MNATSSTVLRPSTFAAIALLSALAFSAGARCSPASPTAEFKDLAQIVKVLREGTNTEKAALTESLGLTTPREAINGATRDFPCQSFDEVKVDDVILGDQGKQAVLEAHSSVCWLTFIVIFGKQTAEDTWVWKTTLRINSKYSSVQISFEALIQKPTKEILVRGSEIVRGTGFYQENLTIYRFIGEHLVVVFDEAEKATLAIPTDDLKTGTNTDQELKSTFTFREAKRSNGGLMEIIEKQNIRDHKISVQRQRVFTWDRESQRFRYAPL